jgi:RND family efflux transporter MFP subunit
MKTAYIIFYSALLVFVASCGKQEPAPAKDAHGEEHHEEGNTTTLTAEQMKSLQVEYGRIEQKQLTASLKANGILKVPNQNKAAITSVYGGIIRSILVQPGNPVEKGQTLVTIINPKFIEMQEEFLSLKSKILFAQQEFDRQKELTSHNAGALKNLQQSEAELNALLTRRASVKKQLELLAINTESLNNESITSFVSVSSPVSGTVSKVSGNIGSAVDINFPIVEVVDNSQLHVDLFIYEKDLPKVRTGQVIHFTITNNPGREYDAEIYGISNSFEGEAKALAVHATVKGDKTGLIDGMSISALVSLENATIPAVPTEAIVNFQGNDYIFILSEEYEEHDHHANEKEEAHDHHEHQGEEKSSTAFGNSVSFERIPVRKGTSDVGYSEITLLKEIPSDAKIVVKGAFFILAKMTNSGEGHSH